MPCESVFVGQRRYLRKALKVSSYLRGMRQHVSACLNFPPGNPFFCPLIPENLSENMLFAPFQRKKRLQSLAMSRKLPTFALAFRKGGVNEIFERLRTRRKKTRQRRCRRSGQADVNSYINNKRTSRRAWPDRQKKRPRAALAPQARRAATIGSR